MKNYDYLRVIFFGIFGLMLIIVFCFFWISGIYPKMLKVKTEGVPKIIKEPVKTNTMALLQIISDEDRVYILYDRHCVVSVYDLAGNYLYSISVYTHQNGRASIALKDHKLYLKDKYENVYIFKDDEFIEYIPSESNKAIVDDINFEVRSDSIIARKGSIYRYENGEYQKIIHRPIWSVLLQPAVNITLLFVLSALMAVSINFPSKYGY